MGFYTMMIQITRSWIRTTKGSNKKEDFSLTGVRQKMKSNNENSHDHHHHDKVLEVHVSATTDMPDEEYHVHTLCSSADFDGDGGWRWCYYSKQVPVTLLGYIFVVTFVENLYFRGGRSIDQNRYLNPNHDVF